MSKELAFPLRVDSTGGIAYVSDLATTLQQRVVSAVGTEPGERVMRPTYGTTVNRFMFADMNPADQDDLREAITTSVSTLVPEVRVTSVDLGLPIGTTGSLPVTVNYVLSNGAEGSAKASLDVATQGA